jgi:hypothetical protein
MNSMRASVKRRVSGLSNSQYPGVTVAGHSLFSCRAINGASVAGDLISLAIGCEQVAQVMVYVPSVCLCAIAGIGR